MAVEEEEFARITLPFDIETKLSVNTVAGPPTNALKTLKRKLSNYDGWWAGFKPNQT
ncbi:MAG: hypothetical protein ACI8W8_000611 [Rhodothermales bacterium]|jgi:hypothetical protein